MYIQSKPNEAGCYSNPQGTPAKGLLYLPDEFLDKYIECGGFVILSVEGDTVTGIEKNQEAYEAYLETVPTEEPEQPSGLSVYDELAAAYKEGVQQA